MRRAEQQQEDVLGLQTRRTDLIWIRKMDLHQTPIAAAAEGHVRVVTLNLAQMYSAWTSGVMWSPPT
jgi:hypothetical protein